MQYLLKKIQVQVKLTLQIDFPENQNNAIITRYNTEQKQKDNNSNSFCRFWKQEVNVNLFSIEIASLVDP